MYSGTCPKAGAVFQYFYSQNPNKISKSNGSEGVYCLQKKPSLRGGMATHPKPFKVHRCHFEEFKFLTN